MYNLKRAQGFSLIEVPIVLLMIVIMLVMYHASTNTLLLNKDAHYKEIAHRIGNSEMENLRNLGYSNLPAAGSFTHPSLSSLPGGQGTVTFSDFNPKIKQATVTVSWTDPSAKSARSMVFTTLIYLNGLKN